jgi:S1-C subfamily serine protease
MKRTLVAAAVAVFALAAVAPAFAGGASCSHSSASLTSSEGSCHGKSATSAWSGAWLQRSSSGAVVVADVAKGSPAAKGGLKKGDVVLAVNGYNIADSKEAAMCASRADCTVGKTVAYTVQRGSSTKSVKVKLEKLPDDAAARYANRNASFDPALAAVVIPVTN